METSEISFRTATATPGRWEGDRAGNGQRTTDARRENYQENSTSAHGRLQWYFGTLGFGEKFTRCMLFQ
jgi:hypothetical protein